MNHIVSTIFLFLSMFYSLLDIGRFFSFLILYTVGRTPWKGYQPVARPLPTHENTNTEETHTDIHASSAIFLIMNVFSITYMYLHSISLPNFMFVALIFRKLSPSNYRNSTTALLEDCNQLTLSEKCNRTLQYNIIRRKLS
jgi:hypothetical protein